MGSGTTVGVVAWSTSTPTVRATVSGCARPATARSMRDLRKRAARDGSCRRGTLSRGLRHYGPHSGGCSTTAKAASHSQHERSKRTSSESVRPHLLTYAEVAAWLGRSVTFVEKAVRFRGLPVVRQGRNVRFDRQEVRHWMDEQDEEWDNRITPVRPTPRGGHREVYPRDTIGDLDSCWCGDSLDHDWPGKQTGAPHPHDHEGMQQVVLVQIEEEPQEGRIDRKMLHGFHGTL